MESSHGAKEYKWQNYLIVVLINESNGPMDMLVRETRVVRALDQEAMPQHGGLRPKCREKHGSVAAGHAAFHTRAA